MPPGRIFRSPIRGTPSFGGRKKNGPLHRQDEEQKLLLKKRSSSTQTTTVLTDEDIDEYEKYPGLEMETPKVSNVVVMVNQEESVEDNRFEVQFESFRLMISNSSESPKKNRNSHRKGLKSESLESDITFDDDDEKKKKQAKQHASSVIRRRPMSRQEASRNLNRSISSSGGGKKKFPYRRGVDPPAPHPCDRNLRANSTLSSAMERSLLDDEYDSLNDEEEEVEVVHTHNIDPRIISRNARAIANHNLSSLRRFKDHDDDNTHISEEECRDDDDEEEESIVEYTSPVPSNYSTNTVNQMRQQHQPCNSPVRILGSIRSRVISCMSPNIQHYDDSPKTYSSTSQAARRGSVSPRQQQQSSHSPKKWQSALNEKVKGHLSAVDSIMKRSPISSSSPRRQKQTAKNRIFSLENVEFIHTTDSGSLSSLSNC